MSYIYDFILLLTPMFIPKKVRNSNVKIGLFPYHDAIMDNWIGIYLPPAKETICTPTLQIQTTYFLFYTSSGHGIL